MFAIISGPEFYQDINKALADLGESVTYKRIDRDIDIVDEAGKIDRLGCEYLVLDISCVEEIRKVPETLRRLRGAQSGLRVFIIAPSRLSGSEVINALISQGIYDIIGKHENAANNIDILLVECFRNPMTYAMALKWDDGMIRRKQRGKAYINDGLESISQSLSKTIEKDKIVGTVIIAVAGAMSRVGTTHTCLSIAQFLLENRHGVAVVEMYDSNTFEAIKNAYENLEAHHNRFSINGIDYYGYNPSLVLADLTLEDYAYIILDLGVYSECNIMEFRRAHERIIVSGVKDWEIQCLENVIKGEDKNIKNRFYFTFSDTDSFKFIKSSMDPLLCYHAPYNPQPFNSDDHTSEVLATMLKGVLPQENEQENDKGLFRAVFKKREKLYHKPVLVDKINESFEDEQKRKKSKVKAIRAYSLIRLCIYILLISVVLTFIVLAIRSGLPERITEGIKTIFN